MSGQPVLSVSGVSKKYCASFRHALAYGVADVAHELSGRRFASADLRPGEFWAVDDVSFELAAGDALAVVGPNGAGKSTLLKILAGLIKPDRGTVRIRGRTRALLGLGTEFNPLLSGRENILVGAAVHGLGPREARAISEQVVSFAELEEFIDAPLQTYSSGMKSRLAYALSSHLRPDLLFVDEVLVVGDFAFQRKCINHMRSYLEQGGALLLVTHNIYQTQAVCQRGILLDHGRMSFSGSAVDTINRMFESRPLETPAAAGAVSAGDKVTIDRLEVEPVGEGALQTGEPMRVSVSHHCAEAVDVHWGFEIWTSDKWICITGALDERVRRLDAGAGELTCVVPHLPLLPGRYLVRAHIIDPRTGYPFATIGHSDTGAVINVRSTPSMTRNGQSQIGQLVTTDVAWQAPAE